MKDFTSIIILVIVIVVFVYIKRNFKPLNLGAMSLVTGGVKTGKSTLAVYMAIREYKRRLRRWKVNHFIYRVTRIKLFDYEKPLLYSNVPLKCEYSPVTKDLLLRKTRFVYGSVIYIMESSLVADSMSYKVVDNDALLLFNKLIGHETKGGCLIYDTQSVSDNHFAVKRCLNNYFYIQKLCKWLPFFLVAYVKECRYSDDGSVVSVDVEDLDTTMKKVIIPKRTWKKFDCYCYSAMTDNLPVDKKVINNKKGEQMKATDIVSFKEYTK